MVVKLDGEKRRNVSDIRVGFPPSTRFERLVDRDANGSRRGSREGARVIVDERLGEQAAARDRVKRH